MSLSEIISNMDLTVWAEVAMVIFMLVFFAVVYRVCQRPSEEMERFNHIPLDDDSTEAGHV